MYTIAYNYVQDFLDVYNFLLHVLALVILTLLGCALAQDRIFSWNGPGEPSDADPNENGEKSYK